MSSSVVRPELIDPRDATAEVDWPTYRVEIAEGGSVVTWRLHGASDAYEVLAWAEAHGERSSTVVYVEDPGGQGSLTLVRIAGPAATSGADGASAIATWSDEQD